MPLAPITINDGQVSTVDSLSSAASSVINWELDDAGISTPRAPLVTNTISNMRSSPVIGLFHWTQGFMMAVTEDRYVHSINDLVPEFAFQRSTSDTSTQVAGDRRPTFVGGQISVYMAGGGKIQRWSATAPTSETYASSPDCTHIASLGNRLIANDLTNANQIRWSDIGEGAWNTWPVLNFLTVDARPDPVIALDNTANELFVFGSNTLQIYSTGSDPTLPFELVVTIETGIAAPYAYVRLDASYAFLDDKRRIVISNGRSVEEISAAIKHDLRSLSTISDCWAYREENQHSSYVVFRFPTERRTFVYDLDAKNWHERKTYVAPFQEDFATNAYAYWPILNRHLFGSPSSSGGLYKFSDSHEAELGGPLLCERTTGWHDFGSAARKRSARVRAFMKRGAAPQNETPSALEVRVQNDDGPWSDWQFMSIGVPEDYQQVQDAFMGGIFRRRRYGFRYSGLNNTALVSAFDEVSPVEMGS